MVSSRSDESDLGPGLPDTALIPLEALRLLSLLLLSSIAVVTPVLVFSADQVNIPQQIGLCALALIVGARFGGRLADAVSRIISIRWFSGAWVFYFLWAGWVIASLRDASVPGQVSFEWVRLVMLQPLMLLLGSLRGGHRPAIVNGLMLTIVGCHAGGAATAGAVVGFVATMGCFLVFDHWRRTLAAFPVTVVPSIFVPLRQSLLRVAVVSACLLTYFTFFPPTPASAVAQYVASGVPLPQPSMAELWRAAVQLGVAIAVSAVILYALGRFLGKRERTRKRGEELAEEVVAGHMLGDTRLADEGHAPVIYSGSRGKIVRCYLALLATHERSGGKRLPSQTPRELAPALTATFADTDELTRLFEAARYGRIEPARDDVKRAETLTRHLEPVGGLIHKIREITQRIIKVGVRPPPRPPRPGQPPSAPQPPRPGAPPGAPRDPGS